MAAILKISKYCRWVHFDIRYGKIVKNYPRKDHFNVDDVSDDVTVRLWTLSSIFIFRRPPDTKMAITPPVFFISLLISLLDQKLFLHEYGVHFVKI